MTDASNTNPYAAPAAELEQTKPEPLGDVMSVAVAARRQGLRMFGTVRAIAGPCFYGIGLLLIRGPFADGFMIFMMVGGGLSIIVGCGLALRYAWGRRLAIAETIGMIYFALSVLDGAFFGEHLLAMAVALLAIALNISLARVLWSPLTRMACDRRADALAADAPSEPPATGSTLAVVAVIAFSLAVVGANMAFLLAGAFL